MAVVSRNPKVPECMEINYIEIGKSEDAENFLSLLAGYAREKGYSRVHTMVPENVELDAFLKKPVRTLREVSRCFHIPGQNRRIENRLKRV